MEQSSEEARGGGIISPGAEMYCGRGMSLRQVKFIGRKDISYCRFCQWSESQDWEGDAGCAQ